jgi:hypothetical protein
MSAELNIRLQNAAKNVMTAAVFAAAASSVGKTVAVTELPPKAATPEPATSPQDNLF